MIRDIERHACHVCTIGMTIIACQVVHACWLWTFVVDGVLQDESNRVTRSVTSQATGSVDGSVTPTGSAMQTE